MFDPDLERTAGWVGAATTFLVGIAALVRRVFKGISTDRFETADDTAQFDAIALWKEEARTQRARADLAFEQRNTAIEELGRLRERTIGLARLIQTLEEKVIALEKQIEQMRGSVPR